MLWERVKSHLTNRSSETGIIIDNKAGMGLVIFEVVEQAIKAEKLVKNANLYCKLVAPPPALRKGCDLALQINLIEQPAIERCLDSQVHHLGISPLSGTRELLQIVKITSFPKHTMVKAGNMKIVFEIESGIIVNTSGGGCPDIPYLNLQLVGKKLTEARHPKDLGYTLCSLMLDRAFEEALSLWEGRKNKCC